MKSHSEQIMADLFRALFKMDMLDINKLDKMVDELQVRLFRKELEIYDSKTRSYPLP
jgi:hypothetical protein